MGHVLASPCLASPLGSPPSRGASRPYPKRANPCHGDEPWRPQLEFEDHCWRYCPRASIYVTASDSYHVGRRKHGASHGSRSLTVRRNAKHAMEQPYYALWIATASYALRVLCCSLCVAWRGVAGISRGVLAMNGSPGPSVSLITVGQDNMCS